MTTIAYKAGILACDSQASDGGRKYKAKAKAQKAGSKVYVVAGTLTVGLTFIRALRAETYLPDLDDDTCVVEFDVKTAEVRSWEGSTAVLLEDKIGAWGSGGDIALGAITAGASAEEAVKIAAAWDESTGMGIQVFKSERAK